MCQLNVAQPCLSNSSSAGSRPRAAFQTSRGLVRPQRSCHPLHQRPLQESPLHTAAQRRDVLHSTAGAAAVLLCSLASSMPAQAAEALSKYEPMDALQGKDYGKPRMMFPDFTMSPSGLQYKDYKEGSGEAAGPGDTCVVDWGGYTIGYYGRPFEARNKAKGGAFTGDNKEYLRFVLGSGEVIPGFDEAVVGMRPGGIRRVVVPPELGYPDNDYNKQGPKPTNFSGERALGFVLGNKGMIDKTLMFDIELIRLQRGS